MNVSSTDFGLKLNYLIKVDLNILFSFPFGGLQNYRKFLNHKFFTLFNNYVNNFIEKKVKLYFVERLYSMLF